MKELVTFHGASGKLGDKLIAAHKAGLRVREITHGMNGYPEPFKGEFFITGFDTLADAKAFAAANGGEVGTADHKDGRSNVERFFGDDRGLTIMSDLAKMLGDNDRVMSAADYREQVAEDIADIAKTDEDDLGEEEAARLADLKIKLVALANIPADHILHIDLANGTWEVYETDAQMSVSYDTRNTEVGVMLEQEEEIEEEDAE